MRRRVRVSDSKFDLRTVQFVAGFHIFFRFPKSTSDRRTTLVGELICVLASLERSLHMTSAVDDASMIATRRRRAAIGEQPGMGAPVRKDVHKKAMSI